jgi:hypothetical protein
LYIPDLKCAYAHRSSICIGYVPIQIKTMIDEVAILEYKGLGSEGQKEAGDRFHQ